MNAAPYRLQASFSIRSSTPANSARVRFDAHPSSMSRMKTGTPAPIAPGVSVAGMMTSATCSSSANCSDDSAGPRFAPAFEPRVKRVNAAAPPTSSTAPSNMARRLSFGSLTDNLGGSSPGVSATLHRTGWRSRAAALVMGARRNGPTGAAKPCRDRGTGARRPARTRLDRGAGRDRRRLDVGDGRVRGFLEHHRFPGGRVGDELAQQLIVQLVAGLVAAELADQAVAE